MRSLRMPVLAAGLLAVALGATQANAGQGRPREYVVVYEEGASAGAAHAAIEDAGGQIVSENADIGVATVRSADGRFADQAAAEPALVGAAANKPIGMAPKPRFAPKHDEVERF